MGESTIFGVSARGILALLITLSCCAVAVWLKDILTLKDLAFLVLGFYFGQKPVQPTNTQSTVQTIPEVKTGG